MVAKMLVGLLGAAALAWGVGEASDSSSASEEKPSLLTTKSGPECLKDRSGRSCGGSLSIENDEFAISPDGRNGYRAIPFFGADERAAIWIYDRNPGTGSLVQKQGTAGCIAEGRSKDCVRGRGLGYTSEIVVGPDGRNVYVSTLNSILIFDRDPVTGDLTQPAGASGCITSHPKGNPACAMGRGDFGGDIAISPDGLQLYDSGRGLAILDRDPATGALTQKPGREGLVPVSYSGDVLVSPDGENVYLSASEPMRFTDRLITFDRDAVTGSLARVPAPAGCVSEGGEGGCRRGREFSISDLTISPDGRNVYGLGHVVQKVAVLVLLDRLPDGTLVQKPGRAGCIGSESGKRCVNPFSLSFLSAENDIAISADGKRVHALEYDGTFEKGVVFIRHPSGRLTEAAGDR